MDVSDGNVTYGFYYQMLQGYWRTQTRPGIHAHFINRLSRVNVTGEFLTD